VGAGQGQLDPAQARRLLQRITADGKLELVGERRGARYVRRAP